VATPLILAAAALPWVQIDVRRRLALVTWAGTFLLLYGTYSCTHEEWWYLRFLLPALPALLIGAALALQSLVQAQWVLSSQLVFPHRRVPEGPVRRWTISLPALLLVAALGWQLVWCRHFDVRHVELNERNYRDVSRWIADQLPERSLIAASQTSGAIFFYSDKLAVRWDRLTPESYARLNGYLDQQRLTLYAALFKHERAAALEKAMPGRWESVANFRDVIVWRRSQTTPAEGSAAP
jgi:hypothetical protein